MFRDGEVEGLIKRTIATLEAGKEELQKRVEKIIEEDPSLKAKLARIITIKGLGIQSAALIIAELNAFALIENQAQLVSYVGYDVVENQSGKHSGRTRISKKGNAHIRKSLHFPSLNVIKYGTRPFKQLYDRVYERSGIKMKAYTAVQKKLLITIYALWKNDTEFDPQYGVIQDVISGDVELEPSFSSVSQKPNIETQNIDDQAENKLALGNPKAKQDEHPSKNRRMPSFS